VPAAGLADVVVGDDHPAMAVRGGNHPLDQAAVRLLDLRAAGELRLRVAQAQGQSVAYPLQLGGRKQPRPADRTDPPLEPGPREGRGEELAEATLEIGDLTPEVVARELLGARGNRRAENIGAGRGPRDLGLVEHGWHGGSLTRLPARSILIPRRGRFQSVEAR
jgi:hypothetical protein